MTSSRYGPPKMPVRQLWILSVARFCEPLALTSILPYLPEMVESFGVDKKDVGRWAGICMGAFSISQSAVGIPWGAASDRIGRKPAVVFGLFTAMITFILWGFCTSLPMAICVRIFGGVSNGNVGIIRTMVGEMVPWKELQPIAFAIMPMIWSVGSVFGPSMGGFFANPARRWPSVFGDIQFFHDYPYALPNLIAAVIFTFSLASAILFLEETMESKKNRKDWGLVAGRRILRALGKSNPVPGRHASHADDNEAAPLVRDQPSSEAHRKPAPPAKHTVRDVLTRQTVCFLAAYFGLGFITVSCDQVLAVFLSYPYVERTPENTRLPFYFSGGFGFGSDKIGTLFTIYGIVGLLQLFIFPPICRALGPMRSFRTFSLVHPIYLSIMPFIVLIPDPDLRWYGVLCVMLVKNLTCAVAFPSLTILITNSASSADVLGTVNGASVTVAGLGRAIGPALGGTAFTWGVRHGYVVSAWFLLALVSLVFALPAFFVTEPGSLSSRRAQPSEEENGHACESDEDDDDDGNVDVPSGTTTGSDCEEDAPLLAGDGRVQQGYGTRT